MAVDPLGGKVYWTVNLYLDFGEVWRANLDGSGYERLVSGLDFGDCPQQVELNFSAGKMYINAGGAFSIVQANFDGTELEPFSWYDSGWNWPIALNSMILPEPVSIGSLHNGFLRTIPSGPQAKRQPPPHMQPGLRNESSIR